MSFLKKNLISINQIKHKYIYFYKIYQDYTQVISQTQYIMAMSICSIHIKQSLRHKLKYINHGQILLISIKGMRPTDLRCRFVSIFLNPYATIWYAYVKEQDILTDSSI